MLMFCLLNTHNNWNTIMKVPALDTGNESRMGTHSLQKKVKFSVSMPWGHTGGIEVWLHTFLTLPIDGHEWLASRPSCFATGKRIQYPFSRRLDGPQSQSDILGKSKISCPYQDSILGPPANSLVAIPSMLLWLHSLQTQNKILAWCWQKTQETKDRNTDSTECYTEPSARPHPVNHNLNPSPKQNLEQSFDIKLWTQSNVYRQL
jgi:hypothetical protein